MAIWRMTRSFSRMLSAEKSSKLSAQSPAWSKNALPDATRPSSVCNERASPANTSGGSVADSAEARNLHAAKVAQDEFGFGEVERRGHFEKTDRNLFDGHDLDVPTYLRKGIKISI